MQIRVNFNEEHKKLWEEAKYRKETSQGFNDFCRTAFHDKIDSINTVKLMEKVIRN